MTRFPGPRHARVVAVPSRPGQVAVEPVKEQGSRFIIGVVLAICLLAAGCAERQAPGRIAPAQAITAAQSRSPPPQAVQARHPIAGFDLTPPSGFVASGDPINGTILGDPPRLAIRVYWNSTAQVEVTVAVHLDGRESAQSLSNYAAHEGRVTEVKPASGTLAMWELTPAETPNQWTSLVAQLPDGSYVWVNEEGATGFDTLYDFLFRVRDAPGSMPPR